MKNMVYRAGTKSPKQQAYENGRKDGMAAAFGMMLIIFALVAVAQYCGG